MSKYDPLGKYLSGLTVNEIELPYAEISGILGFELPPSHANRSWWCNDPKKAQAKAWLINGWETTSVKAGKVRFVRSKRQWDIQAPREKGFKEFARQKMSVLLETTLRRKAVNRVPRPFDMVSDDETIVGEIMSLKSIKGRKTPLSKFTLIDQRLWFLQATGAPKRFLVVGGDREVIEAWLKRYRRMLDWHYRVYYIDQSGKEELLKSGWFKPLLQRERRESSGYNPRRAVVRTEVPTQSEQTYTTHQPEQEHVKPIAVETVTTAVEPFCETVMADVWTYQPEQKHVEPIATESFAETTLQTDGEHNCVDQCEPETALTIEEASSSPEPSEPFTTNNEVKVTDLETPPALPITVPTKENEPTKCSHEKREYYAYRKTKAGWYVRIFRCSICGKSFSDEEIKCNNHKWKFLGWHIFQGQYGPVWKCKMCGKLTLWKGRFEPPKDMP